MGNLYMVVLVNVHLVMEYSTSKDWLGNLYMLVLVIVELQQRVS